MVAPVVEQARVTCCELLNVPPLGVIVGVATVAGLMTKVNSLFVDWLALSFTVIVN